MKLDAEYGVKILFGRGGKRWLLLSFSMEFGLAIEVADHALLKDLVKAS